MPKSTPEPGSNLPTPLSFPWQLTSINLVRGMITLATVILFLCSSVRHGLFQSGAFDLGIFDQAVYLISQGKPPISSLIGFHILGDHAAWILYPLALLYKIYPSVYWLLAVQAFALALGAFPTWYLGRAMGLNEKTATAVAGVYLLYPLVFNVNLFDFHPEVIAVPALLAAMLAARWNKMLWFCAAIVVVLGCKAVLALTVAAMGVWLLGVEKKRMYGAIALFAGVAWFAIATQVIIPSFGEAASVARHLPRYQFLGDSIPSVLLNLIRQPQLILGKVFSLATVEYLGLLLLPILGGISLHHLAPLIAAIPALMLNILSEVASQRNLIQQYSLPILPFLIVTVIQSLAARKAWVSRSQNRQGFYLILGSVLAFLALGKYGYFGSVYVDELDTWSATRNAIAQVTKNASVLTTHEIVPHLSHRSEISFTDSNYPPTDLTKFDSILLNLRHPGWQSSPEFAANLITQLESHSLFQLQYHRHDVYLFEQVKDIFLPSKEAEEKSSQTL